MLHSVRQSFLLPRAATATVILSINRTIVSTPMRLIPTAAASTLLRSRHTRTSNFDAIDDSGINDKHVKSNRVVNDLDPVFKRASTPYDLAFEGINFHSDLFLLNREQLQNRILNLPRLGLITGPPACGESSLIQLLERRLEAEGKNCFRINLLAWRGHNMHERISAAYTTALQSQGVIRAGEGTMEFTELHSLAIKHFDYIFIDDAQLLYSSSIIDGMVKNYAHIITNARASVFFFASTAPKYVHVDAPVVFNSEARINWNDIRLSEDEQQDFTNRFLRWAQQDDPKRMFSDKESWMQWLTDMMPIICKDTGGHVGVLRMIALDLYLFSTSKEVLDRTRPNLDKTMRQYYLGNMLESCWLRRAGLRISSKQMTPGMQKLLRTIIDNERLPPQKRRFVRAPFAVQADDPDSADKLALMRQEILTPVEIRRHQYVLEFASAIHRRFWFRQAFPSAVTEDQF